MRHHLTARRSRLTRRIDRTTRRATMTTRADHHAGAAIGLGARLG